MKISTKYIQAKQVVCGITAAMTFLAASPVHSIDLSDSAIEVITGVEPNLVLLADDSGSMDWEVMTSDEDKGGTHYHTQSDGTGTDAINHRSGCTSSSGLWGSTYGYMYTVYFAANAYRSGPSYNVVWNSTYNAYEWVPTSNDYCHVAADDAWRMRNSDYNPLYFDPTQDYEPWSGVDSAGNAYADMPVTAALENPWDPSSSTINLTTKGSLNQNLNDGFRFYTWSDDDSDGDFDDGEETQYGIGDLKNPDVNALDALRTAAGKSALGSEAAHQQNFANWFSYYRKREYTMKAAMGAVLENVSSARIGFVGINNNGNVRQQVASMNISPNSGNKKTLMDALYGSFSYSGTPLRQNLENTGRYFSCETGDIFGSSSSSSPGDAACPMVTTTYGGNCQQNYALLLTDGYYNGSDPSVDNTDEDDDSNFDGGAFADTYDDTLADVAMYYYENDLHDDTVLTDDVPATTYDVDRYPSRTGGESDYPTNANGQYEPMHQHMGTYTIGFGVTGTISTFPTDPTVAFTWTDPTAGDAQKIDDLLHAAYNGRGLYLSATDHESLSASLTTAIDQIQAGVGTASAVAFNTQNLQSGSLVFRALFNTTTNSGDLEAFSIDTQGNIATTATWSAADMLDSKVGSTSDTRVIVTYKDLGTTSSIGIDFAWSDLTSPRTTVGTQQYYLDQISPNAPANVTDLGDERLDYLRGQDSDEGDDYDNGEFRERPTTAGKLGDIVHSSPIFVGQPPYLNRNTGEYPDTNQTVYSKYREDNVDRTPMVYVGANDGMLHGFNVEDGSERFAFIPNKVFPNLSELTRFDYNHMPFVDLTPSVNDAFIETTRGTNRNSLTWNTVLVGGLRGGGKGYFALNISDPDDLDTTAEVIDNVMWEFTDGNDSRLGYSYSKSAIVMSKEEDGSGNNRWYALFGNGYNATHTDGESSLFAIKLEGGLDGDWTDTGDYYVVESDEGTLPTETSPDDFYQDQFEGQPNGLGGVRAVDIDGDGTVDYAYAGDLRGNLYRFDLTNSNPANWTKTKLFTAKYSVDNSFQPITNTPIAVPHPTGVGIIVVFGTGSWMTVADATTDEIQSIYGIWDDLGASISYPVAHSSSASDLQEQTYINQVNQEHDYVVRTLSDNAVDWTTKEGWYIDLDVADATDSTTIEFPGERAIRNFQFRAGIAFVNTVFPKNQGICSVSPGGFQLAFNPETGGSFSQQVFDLNNDGVFDVQDNVGDAAGTANVVAGTRFEGASPTDASFIGEYRFTQLSDRTVERMAVNTLAEGRRTSWREFFVLD
ncbi:MAG: PilC/PilY family type IV pilus protein [Sedimenticola sp.]